MFGDSHRLEAAIDSARADAHELSNENQSRLAQLMTIWASGYLEATCREVLRAYARHRSDPSVLRFVSRNLERFRSPTMDNVLNLIRSFDEDRARQLEDFASGSIKESVNGMVAQRHRIAHGRSTDTTIARVSQQFEDARKMANKLKALFQLDTAP